MSRRRSLEAELAAAADPERARSSAWFFKTGKGDYGEDDHFLGIAVPAQRKIARRYRDLPLTYISRLLGSPLHEHRFVALEILVFRDEKGSPEEAVAKKWLAERYPAPSDDLQQPVDLQSAADFDKVILAIAEAVANQEARPRWNNDSFFRRFAAHAD